DPRAAAAQLELSKLQLAAGQPRDSVKTAEEAQRMLPGNLDARLAVVRGLIAVKDVARADTELAPLVAARPNAASVQVQVGILAALRGNLSAARTAFDRALDVEPDSLEAIAGLISLDLGT